METFPYQFNIQKTQLIHMEPLIVQSWLSGCTQSLQELVKQLKCTIMIWYSIQTCLSWLAFSTCSICADWNGVVYRAHFWYGLKIKQNMLNLPISNHCDELESDFSTLLKYLKQRQDEHRSLYDYSNRIVAHRQQLEQNLFINDEIRKHRDLLADIRHNEQEIRAIDEKLLDKYEHLTMVVDEAVVFSMKRIVSRVHEITSAIMWNYQDRPQYYVYLFERFERKCQKIVDENHLLKPHEVIRMFCKYIRHLINVELERLTEITQILENNDFASLQYFKSYFYQILLQKDISKKEKYYDAAHRFIPLHDPNHSPVINQHPHLQISSHRPIPTNSDKDDSKSEKRTERQSAAVNVSVTVDDQHHEAAEKKVKYISKIETTNLLIRRRSKTQHKNYEDPTKDTANEAKPQHKQYDLTPITNSQKRQHIKTYSQVMNICKEHFIDNIETQNKEWQAKSLYSDLVARNKANFAQQLSFLQHTQKMPEAIAQHHPSTFYHYVDEPAQKAIEQQIVQPHKSDSQGQKSENISRKRIVLPAMKVQNSGQVIRKSFLEKRDYTKAIHRSIDCKPKQSIPNIEEDNLHKEKELYASKHVTIGLPISQQKLIPPKNRPGHLPDIMARAASMGNLKHHFNFKVVKTTKEPITERVGHIELHKEIEKEVNIFHAHHNADKLGHDSDLHAKIDRKIKQQLKASQNPNYLQELHKNLAKFCEIKKKVIL